MCCRALPPSSREEGGQQRVLGVSTGLALRACARAAEYAMFPTIYFLSSPNSCIRSVSLIDNPVERCDELPYNEQLTSMTYSIAFFSAIYQILLVKACVESYNILKLIFKKRSILNEKKEDRSLSKDEGVGKGGDMSSPWSNSPVIGAISNVGLWLRGNGNKKNGDSLAMVDEDSLSTPLINGSNRG